MRHRTVSEERTPVLSQSGIDPLQSYKSKRDFSVTPEPIDSNGSHVGPLSFVIQKHWASSLHYDLRLQLGNTMKSWAVPKGPSFDPKIKRMAVHVEDHPMSYANFEGTIPPKQYGAGKVIVWDQGIWAPLGDPHQGYRDGNLKFELRGHKLHGKWALIRMKGQGEKQEPWLLIKERDAFVRSSATYSVVDELPDSVKSLAHKPTPSAGLAAGAHSELPSTAKPAPLPASLAPQLATLVTGAPIDPEAWLYEIKFDGYRMLTRIDASDIRLFTRNGHDWSSKLQPLRRAIARLKLPPGWYDGEIVVTNDDGMPDFGALQQSFESGQTNDVVLYLFDLPYFNGHDLRRVPLEARRRILAGVLAQTVSDKVRFSEVFQASPQSVLNSACKLGLEGVIAKRRDASYQSSRSTDWIKLKCSQRQEFVVAGYTSPQGARSGFGSLLLGVYDDTGSLQFAGHVGSGFTRSALDDIKKLLDGLERKSSPFAANPKIEGRPHWVEPTSAAEVSFSGWTRSGRIRHGVFRGMRTDKEAATIVRETAVQLKPSELAPNAHKAPAHASSTRLRVTNPDRVIDASSGITKIELVNYYRLIGGLMMGHLKGRPVSLVRAPTGVGGELFFQKHTQTDKLPGIRQLDPALHIGHPAMIEVASQQGLLSAAQWNVIEFHTLNTGTKSFAHPDRMVFDLDPGEGVDWVQVQEAAQLVRSFLDQLGLPSFLKTSGGKGLHVVVPLRKVHGWDTVKDFSHAIVRHMAKTIPQRFVAKSGPTNRIGKIFIDYLRNGLGSTTVCAWSARSRAGLGISVPVDWRELASLRGGDHWTVRSVHERLHVGNEPWKNYARAAKSLTAAMSTLGFAPSSAVAVEAAPAQQRRSKTSSRPVAE